MSLGGENHNLMREFVDFIFTVNWIIKLNFIYVSQQIKFLSNLITLRVIILTEQFLIFTPHFNYKNGFQYLLTFPFTFSTFFSLHCHS